MSLTADSVLELLFILFVMFLFAYNFSLPDKESGEVDCG